MALWVLRICQARTWLTPLYRMKQAWTLICRVVRRTPTLYGDEDEDDRRPDESVGAYPSPFDAEYPGGNRETIARNRGVPLREVLSGTYTLRWKYEAFKCEFDLPTDSMYILGIDATRSWKQPLAQVDEAGNPLSLVHDVMCKTDMDRESIFEQRVQDRRLFLYPVLF